MKSSNFPCILLLKSKERTKGYGYDFENNQVCRLIRRNSSRSRSDKYYISVIPTLLGNGVRLLGNIDREIKLRLCKTQTYNGITDLIYMRR